MHGNLLLPVEDNTSKMTSGNCSSVVLFVLNGKIINGIKFKDEFNPHSIVFIRILLTFRIW